MTTAPTPYFQTEDVTLYCGDCLHILPHLGKVDAVVTDPPYGVNYEGGHLNKRKRKRIANDADASMYPRLFSALRHVVNGPCYVFYANMQSDTVIGSARANGFDIHNVIVWHKTNAKYASMGATYKNRYEPILYCKPKGTTLRWCGPTNERSVWDMPRDPSCNFHPTQKPVAVIERAIRNHKTTTILDPFMGSGTTGVACVRTGRKFIGIELDAAYCEIAKQRIQKAIAERSGNPATCR